MSVAAVRTSTRARENLYQKYAHVLDVNPQLDRMLVSFQANKREPLYRWFKYKEGFSSRLVEWIIQRLAPTTGVLLDPFAGTGAALFASRDLGWDAIGIEILPVCAYAIEARKIADTINPQEFAAAARRVLADPLDAHYESKHAFRHLTITRGAFPTDTEREMAAYLALSDSKVKNPQIRKLLRFACICILEEISYTRKDGQYLRWDYRSSRDRARKKFDKGTIPSFRDSIRKKLRQMAQDLTDTTFRSAVASTQDIPPGKLQLHQASSLEILPRQPANSIDLVLTSPPYCNRYDYTRTYALELAFLHYNDQQVKQLRQAMLSSTVENRAKTGQISRIYDTDEYKRRRQLVERAFRNQFALREVLEALEHHRRRGSINNTNIPRMVRNYFYEISFVLHELSRMLRPGGKIVMVNDNVRYAGEEIPVDLILSDLANNFGLAVSHIWTLPKGKGNSSQQMGRHGRKELRKCVYVWEKPNKTG